MRKFTQIEPFEQYLLGPSLERVHSLVIPCPFERDFIIQGMIGIFKNFYPDLEVKRVNDGALSLFSPHLLYLLEDPKPKDIPTEGFVIVIGEAEGVTLDLSKEKGWEREKRLKRHLLALAKKGGRLIEPKALETLLRCAHFGIMVKEVEKLICYTEGKELITLSDVEELTPFETVQEKGWGALEAFVAGRGPLTLEDPSQFFSLVGQVRYLFQKEKNHRGLKELFEVEYLARTTHLDECFLWKLFTLRYRYALDSSSQSSR